MFNINKKQQNNMICGTMIHLLLVSILILSGREMQVKALEASCSSTAVSDPEEVVFESECRLRDYAIVLGNEYLDF